MTVWHPRIGRKSTVRPAVRWLDNIVAIAGRQGMRLAQERMWESEQKREAYTQ